MHYWGLIGHFTSTSIASLPSYLDMTDDLQPIGDATYGRALRCAIDRLLDQQLIDDENMEAWETSMSPAQRRGLMSTLVADATDS